MSWSIVSKVLDRSRKIPMEVSFLVAALFKLSRASTRASSVERPGWSEPMVQLNWLVESILCLLRNE
ncbi:hypothetical protein HOLleu_43917 [Holothuria leucospilota]|uniref:Uncharacterized protein n=1 Tax=Holothuria leucospilota TaxID=206669 RepID=A0A9Q0Y974_HOLLE|nr:hypothetical protein HOLleu_43917 [Holothuria leucospilota]